MSMVGINPKDIIFSLDIGTRSVIGTVGIVKEKNFHVVAESYTEHKERAMVDGQIHDISLVAAAVSFVKKDLESKLGFSLKEVAIAAAGRFLKTSVVKVEMEMDSDVEINKDIVRSLELTAVKKAEEKVDRVGEGKLYCVGYSVKNFYLNGYIISNLLSHKAEKIGTEIIATFLPRSVIDSLYAVMEKVGLTVNSLTLEPIAAIEAAIPQKLRLLNLVLVDIGAGTSDIAISSKDTISAYGMVPLAGDEATEAIAQACLVDFNTAERMKREFIDKEKVNFIDVLGLENEVSREEIFKIIKPTVEKIAEAVSSKIIELNGGKSPNAVFLVGGGAHTPMLKEALAEKMGILQNRIAIKGREAVLECTCDDNSLGSTGVTVLGIALVSIKRMGNDFIDVILNESSVSMFNSHKHSVMDVMMQAGMSPKVLLAKNGKNIRFTLNDVKRISFGTMGKNATIYVNDKLANIDTIVREGDRINIDFAKDGNIIYPKVIDFMHNFSPISFYLNDEIKSIDPLIFINEKEAALDDLIRDGDNVKIVFPKTIAEYDRYLIKDGNVHSFIKKNITLDENYIICEGDKIYFNVPPKSCLDESEKCQISIIVNGESIFLKGKKEFIFVDIFDAYKFDLKDPKGNLILKHNGEKAGYFDKLSTGDNIEIFWDK